jgi:hypothetical protein
MIPEFDIALSFAGEDRLYVDEVARLLVSKGIKVFYDKFEEANLFGKNLYDYLSDVYANKATYTIMFASENYAGKIWTNLERQAMQSKALIENREYILPVRIDNTPIPGLLPTIYYVTSSQKSPEDLVNLICKKIELLKNKK